MKREKELALNPWTQIWISPREVIRKIVEFNPKFRFFILSAIYGFPVLLSAAQNLSLAETLPLVGIVSIAIVLSVFVGIIGFAISSALLFWAGKWIGGSATYLELRAAVSWGNVPNIVSVLMWILLIANFGNVLFLSDFSQMTFPRYQVAILFFAFTLQTVVAIWSFIVTLKTISEVQGFSIWKALLNFMIVFVMVVLVIWLVAGIFGSRAVA